MSPCLPNPHRVWPMGSRRRRSEGQSVPLPEALPRPPQMAEPSSVSHCASEVGPLSLHTTLLPGFHPGFFHFLQVVTVRPILRVPAPSLMVPCPLPI